MPLRLNLPAAQPVRGVRLATVAAGLKQNNEHDLVLIHLVENSRATAVFTQNAFCAAPVTVAKAQMIACAGEIRALLINAGNANAGTGQPGIDTAQRHCEAVAGALAEALAVPANAVLPFSTGVIGQMLPEDKMRRGIAAATAAIANDESGVVTGSLEAWQAASRGIMTTDTQAKLTSQQVEIDGRLVTITGMAKGAGMIQPNMATMLSYVFTDAAIETDDLQLALQQAVAESFNAITVDSDTSTNDACVLAATAEGVTLGQSHEQWPSFQKALTRVCLDLAQAIIRDAEGATKFIAVNVTGGRDRAECRQVGYAIANSPLVKTAMFASDANVGRLLAAIGKAGVESLQASRVSVALGDVMVFINGGLADGYSEERGAAVMAREEIEVNVDLGCGGAAASIYTSDLSHDYVTINAEYRT